MIWVKDNNHIEFQIYGYKRSNGTLYILLPKIKLFNTVILPSSYQRSFIKNLKNEGDRKSFLECNFNYKINGAEFKLKKSVFPTENVEVMQENSIKTSKKTSLSYTCFDQFLNSETFFSRHDKKDKIMEAFQVYKLLHCEANTFNGIDKTIFNGEIRSRVFNVTEKIEPQKSTKNISDTVMAKNHYNNILATIPIKFIKTYLKSTTFSKEEVSDRTPAVTTAFLGSVQKELDEIGKSLNKNMEGWENGDHNKPIEVLFNNELENILLVTHDKLCTFISTLFGYNSDNEKEFKKIKLKLLDMLKARNQFWNWFSRRKSVIDALKTSVYSQNINCKTGYSCSRGTSNYYLNSIRLMQITSSKIFLRMKKFPEECMILDVVDNFNYVEAGSF